MVNIYVSFAAFSFVASITPGPTNLISLMIGTRKGVAAAIPFVLGASFSAALILCLTGLGLASIILHYPVIETILGWSGAIWISFLAWKLFWMTPEQSKSVHHKPFGWLQGAVLQFINPKTWMMAVSAIGIFSGAGSANETHMLWLTSIFFLIAIPCLLSWSFLGYSASLSAEFSKWEVVFNRAMSVVLLASVWIALLVTEANVMVS